ncbi:Gibberellin-regulated protein 6 [Zostera marina]|uniref:Gibberellin-regulated protein 6 n=1 Tax=Zostera marina TaxID=29655 RepID=A0A0K9NLF0_ZOSMR|nr:Gibberellin-regulated protein 6 [Zostera marina]
MPSSVFSPQQQTNKQKPISLMAKLNLLLLLAFFLLAVLAVEAEEAEYHLTRVKGHHYGPGSVKPYQCQGQCRRRCGKTQYKKPCLFFCNKCCNTCLCVPPGYYGNKSVCPCYNNWKTKRGGPKCP